MILQMCRVVIVSLKSHREELVQAMQDIGCLHIEDVDGAYGLRKYVIDQQTVKKQEKVDYMLTQIEGYLDVMGGRIETPPEALTDDMIAKIATAVNSISPQILHIITKREELKAELDLIPRYEHILRRILTILPESASDPNTTTVGIFVSRTYTRILDDIGHQLYSVTGGQGEINTLDVSEDTRAMLLTFPTECAHEIDTFIGHQDVSRLRLPGDMENQSLDTLMERLQKRLQIIPEAITALDEEVDSLAETWREQLSQWQGALTDELVALQILSKFGETETTCVVIGWLSLKRVSEVRKILQRQVGDAVIVYEEELSEGQQQQMPISLGNSPLVKPFEGLVRLRALPTPGDLDPSRLMAIFMPIFFGMMLGDIGYGAILFVIALGLRRRIHTGLLRDLLYILATGSVWAMIWGLLFGEFFGSLGEYLGLHAILFAREHPEQLVSLLVLSVGVGVVHQVLGLLFGIWQAWQHHQRSHLLERGGMLIGLLGLFLIVGIIVDWLPQGMMTPAFAILIVGIVFLSTSMGWLGIFMGTLEFIGLIGNVLSYLRIAAIGLASVYLAIVANEIAGMIGSVVIGILIAVLIHALNIVLGAFSPSIQSLRLQYVEFFRKFYVGGGRPFEPFKRHYA